MAWFTRAHEVLRSKPKGSHKADYSSFNQDKLNIGTWNGRTMYEAAKIVQVAAEMRRFNLAIRSRNVVNKQDHADKEPDICQPLPANTLDGQGEQQRPL